MICSKNTIFLAIYATTMTSKKILLLLGHPDKSGLCGALTDAYEAGAKEAGHDVRRMNLGDMQFDPILHQGYRARQELEPDLAAFQENIQWCQHFVIVHPVWWVGMPALLKGLFDRAWLPGTAFRYIKTASGQRTQFWSRLLKGRTARIIMTSGTVPWLVRFLPGNVQAQLRWGILWFAGFSVYNTKWFGPSENPTPERKARWEGIVRALGVRGK